MNELRILSPTAILGYGFPVNSFRRGLEKNPDVIAVDGGSTDPGPYYLGSGKSFTDRAAVKRDLEILLESALKRNIPLLVGTAGGSGADAHLFWCEEIVREIAREKNLNFKLATISAELSKDWVVEKYQENNLIPLGPAPELNLEEIMASERIVAQMGVEPLIEALDRGAEVILAGRAYDPTVFAALGIKNGFPAGLALHLGKILECASIAADPGSGSDCMFGILREDHFILEPLNPARRCTATSVAAHTLYEKENPYRLHGPGGIIDLKGCIFEEIDERRVRVKGTGFTPTDGYYLKLEGAKKAGFRTISIAGTRDPIMISLLDEIIKEVKKAVKENFAGTISEDEYKLLFRIYGQNGVMGELEPRREITSHEVGIIIEVVARSQELANTICSFARSTMLHYGYPGRLATAGNLAFPYSPSDLKAGEVYEFNIHHLVRVEDPLKPFEIKIYNVRGGEKGER